MTDPMTTPPLGLPALRETAEAATPGPWEPADDDGWIGADRCYIVSSDENSINDAGYPIRLAYNLPGDAAHIVAFDPPTVLHLIESLEYEREATNGFCADRNLWRTRAEAAEKKVAAGLALAARLKEHRGGWGEHEAAAAIIEALDGTP